MRTTNSKDQAKKESRLKIALVVLLFLSSMALWSQTSNSDFERIKLGSDEVEYSGIALSPDLKTLAICSKKLSPVQLVDWESRKVIQKFNSNDRTYGSKISYSVGGKYLFLQELNYTEFSQNRDRIVDFEIADATTGEQIKSIENVQDAAVSSDEKYAVSLDKDEVTFWNLPDGSKEKSIRVPGAANAVALSPDGKTIAVSEIINEEDIKSQYKKNKKGLKATIKFKQTISLYDVESKSKIKTIGEFYDLIYRLSFSPDGELLLAFQTPEITIQVNNNKQTFINLIDVVNREPLRKGFTSMSIAQPELKMSNNKKLFAINSKGTRFQEIHLYDTETGTLQKRFELGNRLFEKIDGEKLLSDARPSFTFLPGDKSILIAMGNQLVVWNFELNQ